MQYEVMIPPFGYIEFPKMNKRQAKGYFDWYISQTAK